MKVRVSLIGLVAVALALALLGVLNSARPTNALLPQPVQPFSPDDKGGISTTQLGQPLLNYTITEIIQGTRVGLPWIYTGGGWGMNSDAGVPNDTVVGSVTSSIDALCDGAVDVLAKASGAGNPLDWLEKTTAVVGTDEEYLTKIVPPGTWLFRHRADITTLWLFGAVSMDTKNVLNTVYTDVPWEGSGTYVATTKLGGNPAYPSPASGVCLDSPQSSTSITGVIGTPVYSTPPLAGVDVNTDGVDDNSGLYPRWTAFENRNALGFGDSRKPRTSPPSIASDTNYIERIIDLQCYWLDDSGCDIGGGTCNLDATNGISSTESMADDNIPAGIDDDGDCLADAALAQPGMPSESTANDAATGTLCAVLPYSEAPNLVQNNINADRDCDGLVDGVEIAWGSNPAVADTDGDGATDFVEMYTFTNPNVQDTDGDGFKDAPAATYQNSNTNFDNCPSVANPTQANNDGQRRDNGSVVPGNFASNPNQDKLGDACDQDDDNDLAVDVAEDYDEDTVVDADQCSNAVDDDGDTVVNDGCNQIGAAKETAPPAVDQCSNATDDDGDTYINDGCPQVGITQESRETNPLVIDTDGDRCLDGVEGYLGTNPALASGASAKCPAALTSNPLKFFRACRWNTPANGLFGGLWDAEYDGTDDQAEFDPDGDGLVCQTGTTVTDTDNDDGTGTGSLAPVEIVDNVEIMGYGTQAANKDSDGDGCQDWIEMVDVNGNRSAELLDVLFVAKRALGVDPNPGSDVVLDVDKNGSVTILDALVAAKNSSLVKSHSPCAAEG